MSTPKLEWKKVKKSRQVQYQVSEKAKEARIMFADLHTGNETLELHVDIIANVDCLIVCYFLYGPKNQPMSDIFIEFVKSTSSIEEGMKIAEDLNHWTDGFNTSVGYLKREYGFELQY